LFRTFIFPELEGRNLETGAEGALCKLCSGSSWTREPMASSWVAPTSPDDGARDFDVACSITTRIHIDAVVERLTPNFE